jgi:hypothetical protein
MAMALRGLGIAHEEANKQAAPRWAARHTLI